VIMLPVLKRFNPTLAYGFLGMAITATVTLMVGAILLLLLVPLSDEYMSIGSASAPHLETIANLLTKGGFYAYQIGMAMWGLGGLMYVAVLLKSQLIPRAVSIWGIFGYLVFISGTIFELFGNGSLYSVVPGGLFEVFLSIWLIAKGFDVAKLNASTSS